MNIVPGYKGCFCNNYLSNILCAYLSMNVSLPCFAGAAINFAKNYIMSPNAGRRAGVPGVLVILADGPSSDEAIEQAREIKAAGEI